MANMKACPFCGNEAVFVHHNGGEVDVQCSCCLSRGPIQETEERAIAGWNDCLRKSQRVSVENTTPEHDHVWHEHNVSWMRYCETCHETQYNNGEGWKHYSF